MPTFFFRLKSDRYPNGADYGSDMPSRDAAWKELTRVCDDLVRDACRALEQNSAWEIELLDEGKRPIYRISVFGEAVETRAST